MVTFCCHAGMRASDLLFTYGKENVYAVRRHDRSFCAQKQPETAAQNAAMIYGTLALRQD